MNTPLTDRIFHAMAADASGTLSFADYMRFCLYDPQSGYYADPRCRAIGRGGDFYTSVSVGETFGWLLGWAAESRWREYCSDASPFTVVEQGAHDGQLALDFLAGLRERRGPLAESVRYLVCEPVDSRARSLRERFAEVGAPIEVVAAPPAAPAPGSVGLFLCNELLDAFPVHRLRREDGEWRELRVAPADPEKGRPFRWITAPLEPGSALDNAARAIPGAERLPDGLSTEVCLEIAPWLLGASRWFERGHWWIIDYGREEDDYFTPERSDGTLRGYRDHRRCDDPFEAPGDTDLTADVNFTELDRAAAAAGLERVALTDQHHFLIAAAAPWLRQIESDGGDALAAQRQRLRQFQTLTHPDLMGRAFRVAEYRRV